MLFVKIEAKDPYSMKFINFLGVNDYPSLVFLKFEGENLRKYLLANITNETFKNFDSIYKDYKDGKLEVYQKSEAIPTEEENANKTIKKIVGKTLSAFKQIK